MQAGLLAKLFGKDKQWSGPCTVVVDAEATIQVTGTDSIINAGNKVYAPRLISGRVAADAVCYLPEEQALVAMHVQRIRQSGSQDEVKPTFLFLDPAHVAGIEFTDNLPIKALGLTEPPVIAATGAKPRN